MLFTCSGATRSRRCRPSLFSRFTMRSAFVSFILLASDLIGFVSSQLIRFGFHPSSALKSCCISRIEELYMDGIIIQLYTPIYVISVFLYLFNFYYVILSSNFRLYYQNKSGFSWLTPTLLTRDETVCGVTSSYCNIICCV